jgi:hypothetical protein
MRSYISAIPKKQEYPLMVAFRTHPLRWVMVAALVIITVIGAAAPAQAAEYDDDGIVHAGEVIDDDLFMASVATVQMDGIVLGNLFLNSEAAIVNGEVHGDIIASVSNLTINGEVHGNLIYWSERTTLNGIVHGTILGAGNTTIIGSAARVERNLFYGGYSFSLQPGALVSRDLRLYVSQAQINGEVGRNADVSSSALEVGGTIGGDLMTEIDIPGEANPGAPFHLFQFAAAPIPSGMRIAETAVINGRISYTSPQDQGQSILASPADGVYYTPSPTKAVEVTRGVISKHMSRTANLVIFGLFALWLAPGLLKKTEEKMQRLAAATGWGFTTITVGLAGSLILLFVVILLGTLLHVVNLVGLSFTVFSLGFTFIGISLVLLTLATLYLSKLVVSYKVGNWLFHRFAPEMQIHAFWPLLIGIGLYVLLSSIPYLGSVLDIFVTLVGVGAIFMALFRNEKRAVLPVSAPAPAA